MGQLVQVDHDFEVFDGASGYVCTAMVMRDGAGDQCGLPAVSHPTVDALVVPPIPMFEGKEVHATSLKLTNSSNLDLPEVVLHVDDIIQIVVEARVTGVHHMVEERSGNLVRLQTAKPLGARLEPFNPEYDDGVIRDDE